MKEVQAHKNAADRFVSWPDFLERTVEEDREFLPEEAVDRFPAVCCGMANGAGGWIVLGAFEDDEVPVPQGLADPCALEQRLKAVLAGDRTLSTDSVASFRGLDAEGIPLLLVRVESAEWHRRPVCVGGDYLRGVYRRVEGVDLVSGGGARSRYARDALERLRDDLPLTGLAVSDLHEESIASFREAVTARRPGWGALSLENFLAHTQVLADGAVTRAGHLLLGKKGTRVRAVFLDVSGEEEIFEVRSLWKACVDLLPRFCTGVSTACAAALRECFVNALVHADHDAGTIRVTGDPHTVRVENPGLPRTFRPGESLCRNPRLMRMFQLAGLAEGEGRGLASVRSYRPGFSLCQELLELATVAELDLERVPVLSEPVGEGMSVPIGSPAARGDGRGGAVPERMGGEETERDGEGLLSAAAVFPASALEFLVVVPTEPSKFGDAAQSVSEPEDEAVSPLADEVTDPLMERADAVEERTAGNAVSEDSTPSVLTHKASEPPAVKDEDPHRTEKKFAFGSAAEDLELAVARMRRGENPLDEGDSAADREGNA